MEQKDYILREIEKIGRIISLIREKLFKKGGNSLIAIEKQLQDIKGMLLNEINFDLDKFLNQNIEDSNEYISQFKGFNIDNMELLAKAISQIGFSSKPDDSKIYFQKALQLYELCNLTDKTYSFDREESINMIKNAL